MNLYVIYICIPMLYKMSWMFGFTFLHSAMVPIFRVTNVAVCLCRVYSRRVSLDSCAKTLVWCGVIFTFRDGRNI